MHEFKVGDRVVLRFDGADTWIDLKLRTRALRQVPGSVKSIIGTKIPVNRRSYRIEFDPSVRLKALSEIIPGYELERHI